MGWQKKARLRSGGYYYCAVKRRAPARARHRACSADPDCRARRDALRRGPPNGQRLAVDHNHETGEVRGLLCNACNAALGNLGDTKGDVLAAAAYLEVADDFAT
jgi:hypothetical protein